MSHPIRSQTIFRALPLVKGNSGKIPSSDYFIILESSLLYVMKDVMTYVEIFVENKVKVFHYGRVLLTSSSSLTFLPI